MPAKMMHDKWPGYQQPYTFSIYYCQGCNTSFSLPFVNTDKTYNSIYKNVKNVPGYSRYWGYMEGVKKSKSPLDYLAEEEDIYWSVKKSIQKLSADKTKKIIEIGSGLGYLTYSLNKAGYTATGLDISQTAVEQARQIFGDYYLCGDLFQYAETHAGTFDIVIFTEVIEHVPDPILFVNAILSLLKHGGHAIITTPDKSLFPGDIVWETENPPVHFWWFSEDSLKLIAQKCRANISFTRFSEFYKKKYLSIDLKKCRNKLPMQPVLDSSGDLLSATIKRNALKNFARSVVSKISPVKKTISALRMSFTKMKDASNPDIVVCGDKGKVLCAILEKPMR
jgi:SAM-dependent methyltransferase